MNTVTKSTLIIFAAIQFTSIAFTAAGSGKPTTAVTAAGSGERTIAVTAATRRPSTRIPLLDATQEKTIQQIERDLDIAALKIAALSRHSQSVLPKGSAQSRGSSDRSNSAPTPQRAPLIVSPKPLTAEEQRIRELETTVNAQQTRINAQEDFVRKCKNVAWTCTGFAAFHAFVYVVAMPTTQEVISHSATTATIATLRLVGNGLKSLKGSRQ